MSKKPIDTETSKMPDNPRFFFDSSSVFALIECGYFHRFCELIPNFCITSKILTELTLKENLSKKIISESISSGKVKMIKLKTVNNAKWEEYRTLGLHTGEISILLSSRKKQDIIVFDDLVARSVARAEGYLLTGLLGILVKLKKSLKVSEKEAMSILAALNQTNFRMSSTLYVYILRMLSEK